jgi:aspartate aminotransferase
MASVASETYTSTSAPIQHAAITAFRGGLEIERYLWTARRILARLGRSITDRLARAGISVIAPAGGFYVFPDFGPLRARLAERGISTSEQLCHRLLEEVNVAVLPGSAFGRAPEELTLRIAYVDFDGARAMAAYDARSGEDEAVVDRHCSSVLEAIDRIAAWTSS